MVHERDPKQKPPVINGGYVDARRLGLDALSIIVLLGAVIYASWIGFGTYQDLNNRTSDRWHRADMIRWCVENRLIYNKLSCPDEQR